jgi:hypothetical protein
MQGQKTCAGRQERNAPDNKILLLNNIEHVEPCCVVLCRTMQGQKTCAGRQERNAPDNKILLLNKRTCKTVLHDFMQNHVGPKNRFKKTRKTWAGQSSIETIQIHMS